MLTNLMRGIGILLLAPSSFAVSAAMIEVGKSYRSIVDLSNLVGFDDHLEVACAAAGSRMIVVQELTDFWVVKFESRYFSNEDVPSKAAKAEFETFKCSMPGAAMLYERVHSAQVAAELNPKATSGGATDEQKAAAASQALSDMLAKVQKSVSAQLVEADNAIALKLKEAQRIESLPFADEKASEASAALQKASLEKELSSGVTLDRIHDGPIYVRFQTRYLLPKKEVVEGTPRDQSALVAKTTETKDLLIPALSGLSSGPLVVPFKWRLDDKTFAGQASVGLYAGRTIELSCGRVVYGCIRVTPLVAGGVAFIDVPKDGDTTKSDSKAGFTWATGFLITGWDGLNIGLVYGQDRIGDHDYSHEGKGWLSFMVGWDLAAKK